MEILNQTFVRTFILLGLSNIPGLQSALFLIFTLMYMVTLSGNLLIIVVVRLNASLQTPMYFFLSNLAFIDICFSTNIVPNLLKNTISQDRTISFLGCATQMYFHTGLGGTECLMLSVMAYDRYNAICNPLRYNTIVDKRRCQSLATGSWTASFLISVIHVVMTFQLPFCKSSQVDHFFCEMPPLFRLSCTDTWFNEFVVYISSVLFILLSFLLTLSSYAHIISTILKIHYTKGRLKAFSTCTSHLTVVSLYYCTVMCMYMSPRSMYKPDRERVVSILYTVVTPMLNPIIYSVRNIDFKECIRKTINIMTNLGSVSFHSICFH
ncbi:olfactory receptor-like protein OLF3 [Rhinoderma darwinii]|uniref:olfactory receptor-like protein OLF3 n=1 Tax=Rhinoderma darwinii TaxID=43563 RepID=UPI003F666BF3